MSYLSHLHWGADRKQLENIYKALIQSKLDYGSAVYGSAKKKHLQILNPIQNRGMRLITGAFKSSPATSLAVDCDITPLFLHREEENAKVILRSLKCADSRTSTLIKEEWRKNEPVWPPVKAAKELLKLRSIPSVAKIDFSLEPPWVRKNIEICKGPEITDKQNNQPQVIRHAFEEHRKVHENCIEIYTDGSKTDTAVGFATIVNLRTKIIVNKRLSNNASIFSAEAYAIKEALTIIKRKKIKKSVVFSDSKSVLMSLMNKSHPNPVIQSLQDSIHEVISDFKLSVTFCWIPSHCGILGNEEADKEAKNGCDLVDETEVVLPHKDYYAGLKKTVREKWQALWNSEQSNKLKQIKPSLKKWSSSYHKTRRKEVVLARLRIGHTNLTHKHLMEKRNPPVCRSCNVQETIFHILTSCARTKPARLKFYPDTANQSPERILKMLLADENIDIEKLIAFLKDIGIYDKI